jgi:hypothetical protein
MSTDQNLKVRALLAQVAEREAALGRAGNANMAGPEIERYLSVFRDALNRNAGTTKYSDVTVGFSWCCSFVYYCCLEAGFRFPPKPVETYRWTLAAVPSWFHWSQSEGTFHKTASTGAEVGDIVLLNHADVGQPLDHIGIVVGVRHDHVLSAEGNNRNRTGVFARAYTEIEGYVRLPEGA